MACWWRAGTGVGKTYSYLVPALLSGQRMLDRNFIAGGKVTTQLKDQRNVLTAAADAGVALPMTALVTAQYESIAADLPDADHAAALIALERMNPGQRLGDAPDQFTAAASSSPPA